MFEDDIKNIENITHKYKIKYDVFDSEFKEEKDQIKGYNCYVPINLTSLVYEFARLKEAIVDTTDFELHASISILNLYAHYKHYFKSRGAKNVIIMGYVKDVYVYRKYKYILDRVYNYSVFFPGIYTVPDITEPKTPIMYIVASALSYMNEANKSPQFLFDGSRSCNIFVISSSPHDRQLMLAFETNVAAVIFKNSYTRKEVVLTKEDYMRKLCKKEELYDNCSRKSDLELLNFFIGRYFGTMRIRFFYRKDVTEVIHFKTKGYSKKMKLIMKFIEEKYDPVSEKNMIHQLLDYFKDIGELLDKSEWQSLYIYEKEFDYHMQNKGNLLRTIAALIEIWLKKIKDYEINRQSESYQKLIEHQLSINWLM